jgi:ATP-dependent helicase STH1/SNF2
MTKLCNRFDNKSTQEEQKEILVLFFLIASKLLTKTFQHFILEADQDEITEEDGHMNDDELNELIARHKTEVAIFNEMESWHSRGKRGKPLYQKV